MRLLAATDEGLGVLRWRPVESRSIRAIGYDPDRREAWVEFLNRPGPYVYRDVPPSVYAGLERAESKGTYVNTVIKRYPYERRTRWPSRRRVEFVARSFGEHRSDQPKP